MAGTGKRRRSRPPCGHRPYNCNSSGHLVRNRTELLVTINGFYAAALDRLPVGEMPALVPRLLKSGLCVGFSDPVSNIILNTLSSSSSCTRRCVPDRKPAAASEAAADSDEGERDHQRKAAKRRRRRALSRVVADTGDVKYWPSFRRLLRDMPVAARSLEALVAFLTYYFDTPVAVNHSTT
nr:unnamed protein product [Digitaria exilis]CAB3498541.1 unnamed protein product [Digitaria exilis]